MGFSAGYIVYDNPVAGPFSFIHFDEGNLTLLCF